MKAAKLLYTAVADRGAVLSAIRNSKKARSPQEYIRGNTFNFYEWLKTEHAKRLPQGPPVWICGDCHVGNMGPVADAEGNVEVQIRDFDQAVIGNPAHDLVRLGLSLASAARSSDLPGVTTARILEQLVEGYADVFRGNNKNGAGRQPKCVRFVMKRSLGRSWRELAKESIDDTKRTIPLGKRFWPLSKAENAAIKKLFEEEQFRRLVTLLRSRDDDAMVEVLDAAYWVKGCSSLGRLRFAVLLKVNGEPRGRPGFCLMDIKEATKPAAPRYEHAKMPADNALRVVTGAQHLSPNLGERMLAARFLKRSIFVRELLPQDLKVQVEKLSCDEAMKTARFLAAVLGKAHGRQLDGASRGAWRKELDRDRTKSLDAPSWLWSSVVELLISHENAYLEHCRRYVAAGKNV